MDAGSASSAVQIRTHADPGGPELASSAFGVSLSLKENATRSRPSEARCSETRVRSSGPLTSSRASVMTIVFEAAASAAEATSATIAAAQPPAVEQPPAHRSPVAISRHPSNMTDPGAEARKQACGAASA